MAPSVLYHCECNFGVVEQGRGDQPQEAPSSQASSSIPLLPSQHGPSRYSFHPFSSLYYCTECSQIRCHLCSQSEIITHYCPACLFDVPSATVKAERNRCARNCFLCPAQGCGHLLTVTATDPKDYGRMEGPEASLGIAPWFLFCQACKWDSKRAFKGGGGYVFEKSTGLNAQVEAQRGPLPGQVEMEKLRSHYESHLRKQNSAFGGGPSTTTRLSSSLSNSKLLKDLPELENSKYLAGSRRGAALGLDKASASASRSENLPAYVSDLSPASMAVLGKREEDRRSFTSTLGPAQINLVSEVDGRWASGWDQGPKADHLTPLRVPLQTQSTLRCPSCRHILIKPDIKRASHRFKINLFASAILPEVRVRFKGLKNRTGLVGRRSSAFNLREGNRPQSMFLSTVGGGSSSSRGSGFRDENAMVEDAEHLQRGKIYEYEASFLNPDMYAIAVQISVVHPAALNARSGSDDNSQAPASEVLRHPWTVQPSTTRFTVKAHDDMDVIDADLFQDLGISDDGNVVVEYDEFGKALSGEGGVNTNGLGAGVLRREGNETVITLRLDLSNLGEVKEQDDEVEVALKVTFTSRQDPSEVALGSNLGGSAIVSAGQKSNTRSFWTCVRLGKVEGSHGLKTPVPEPVGRDHTISQNDEEERERTYRLRKRRSELSLGGS